MLEIKSCVHCGEHVNAIAIVTKGCNAGGLMMQLSTTHVMSAMFSETHLARIWNDPKQEKGKLTSLLLFVLVFTLQTEILPVGDG